MPKAIPDDHPRVKPGLTVQGAADAIDFYTEVFGAEEVEDRFTLPDGTVAHAELKIGDSVIMLGEENPEFGNKSPKTIGGTPVSLMVYVEDVDETVKRAVERGATQLGDVTDEFYGDRVGRITDPFGHEWHVATHVEDVSDEEMHRRAADLFGG